MESKKCPVCKQIKQIECFYKYFVKLRRKFRFSNYCKDCAKIKANKRALIHYQANKEEKKKYQRDYRANPKKRDQIKKTSIYFKKKYARELHDVYIRDRLYIDDDISVNESRALPELLETKRLKIKITRKLKELKNGKK